MELNSLNDLYIFSLTDLYSVEKQLVASLPLMAKAASTEELKQAFRDHLAQTQTHLERLESIAKVADFSFSNHKCDAMECLIKEGTSIIEMEGEPFVKDSALIVTAQKIEHYEISSYSSLYALADLMGQTDAASLIYQTLSEENDADEKLSIIAEEDVNPNAPMGEDDEIDE